MADDRMSPRSRGPIRPSFTAATRCALGALLTQSSEDPGFKTGRHNGAEFATGVDEVLLPIAPANERLLHGAPS